MRTVSLIISRQANINRGVLKTFSCSPVFRECWYEIRSLVTGTEASTGLISKPVIGHDQEAVHFTSHHNNSFTKTRFNLPITLFYKVAVLNKFPPLKFYTNVFASTEMPSRFV